MEAHKVGAIEDFGEVFGIAVFPPANPCFIRIIDTSEIGALKGIAGEIFFKIATHAHIAIAQTH